MNIGIVGAGGIVPFFLEASKAIDAFKIRAIQGKITSLENMTRLQSKYEIKNIFTDYNDLLNDDIDAIYVAVPNHLHYQFARIALEHRKHVIVEKPFASSLKQAKELVDLANNNQVIIFEAISNQYMPNYLKTKELVKDLGDIKIVSLNYSQYSSRYDLFKKEKYFQYLIQINLVAINGS